MVKVMMVGDLSGLRIELLVGQEKFTKLSLI